MTTLRGLNRKRGREQYREREREERKRRKRDKKEYRRVRVLKNRLGEKRLGEKSQRVIESLVSTPFFANVFQVSRLSGLSTSVTFLFLYAPLVLLLQLKGKN